MKFTQTHQALVLPASSVSVRMVLLRLLWMCTMPGSIVGATAGALPAKEARFAASLITCSCAPPVLVVALRLCCCASAAAAANGTNGGCAAADAEGHGLLEALGVAVLAARRLSEAPSCSRAAGLELRARAAVAQLCAAAASRWRMPRLRYRAATLAPRRMLRRTRLSRDSRCSQTVLLTALPVVFTMQWTMQCKMHPICRRRGETLRRSI